MSTGKKEKTYKGVGRKMAEMEKDIELRKKEGRYFTMQANSFDGEDLGNLVGEGLTYPDGLLLYCRSGNIEIYLKNDYPIIIKYSVANLGEVKFCLAPKNSD